MRFCSVLAELAMVVVAAGWGQSVAAGAPADAPMPEASPNSRASASPAEADWTAERLLAAFRAVPGLFARYREEKTMSLLARPLRSEGTIHYAPPNKFARHQIQPIEVSTLIDGDILRFGDASSQQQIDLQARPQVKTFIDGFLQVLRGDRVALESTYVVQFEAHGSAWSMILVPRRDPLRKLIQSVKLKGTGTVVHEMRVQEVAGDVTVTTFFAVDAAHAYGVAEQRKVFRIAS